MIELFVFFLGFNFIVFILPVLWKKTLVDHYRDQLFDLREEMRGHFIKEGFGLTHPIYQRLRILLNRNILFLEKVNFFTFLGFRLATRNLFKEDVEHFDQLFHSENPSLNEYTRDVRHRAIKIVIRSLFVSSFYVCLFVFCMGCFSLLLGGIKRFFNPINWLSHKFFPNETYLEKTSFYYKQPT